MDSNLNPDDINKWMETFLEPLKDEEAVEIYDDKFSIKPPEPGIDLAEFSKEKPEQDSSCLSMVIVQQVQQEQKIVSSQNVGASTPARHGKKDDAQQAVDTFHDPKKFLLTWDKKSKFLYSYLTPDRFVFKKLLFVSNQLSKEQPRSVTILQQGPARSMGEPSVDESPPIQNAGESGPPGPPTRYGPGEEDQTKFQEGMKELKKSLISLSKQCLHDDQQFTDEEETGLRLWSFQFRKVSHEHMISYFVQRLLGTICELNGVKILPEKQLKNPESSKSRSKHFNEVKPDFVLEYEGVLFGLVEVKIPGTLDSSAVAQLFFQMLKTQHMHLLDEMKYIGILTDGFRFVLMKLAGGTITFDSKKLDSSPQLMVHYARKWKDLFEICSGLDGFVKSAIADIKSVVKLGRS